jgi:hypothetical protein
MWILFGDTLLEARILVACGGESKIDLPSFFGLKIFKIPCFTERFIDDW